jgi:hypothetical protein
MPFVLSCEVKGAFMRSILSMSILAVLALSSVAVAGDNTVHVLPASTSAKSAPVQQVSRRVQVFQPARRSGQTVFGRIMELERRKNAWLRRTFLN